MTTSKQPKIFIDGEAGTPITQGAQIPTGIQMGHGVRPVATQKIFTTGTFKQTDNPLDLAIEGDGFFQILMADGTVAYTRDGAFKQDGEGRIVTSDGFTLEPEIIIPEDAVEITIGTDGTVSVMLTGDSEPQTIGMIELVRFVNPAGLSSFGRNLFVATAASGTPTWLPISRVTTCSPWARRSPAKRRRWRMS